MKNHWIKQHSLNNRYWWMFSIAQNSIFQLKPRIVRVQSRPISGFRMDEKIRIVFPDVSFADQELFTFLGEYCYDGKRTNTYGYLRLMESKDQPIETWSFNKIKYENVVFSDSFGDNSNNPREVELSFSFQSKEYRDILRKLEHKYNS